MIATKELSLENMRTHGGRRQIREIACDIAQYMKMWSETIVLPTIKQLCRNSVGCSSRVEGSAFRIGHGRQTGYVHNDTGGRITYGVKLIEDYLSFNDHRYRSFKEITQYGYMRRRHEDAHSLVHVAVHENAHVLQAERGGLKPGSVHNRAFYRAMDDLYEALGEEALHLLFEAIWVRQRTAFKPEIKTILPRPASIQIGDYVIVQCSALDRIVARVDQVNRRTYTLTWENGLTWRDGLRERVAPELIEPINMWNQPVI